MTLNQSRYQVDSVSNVIFLTLLISFWTGILLLVRVLSNVLTMWQSLCHSCVWNITKYFHVYYSGSQLVTIVLCKLLIQPYFQFTRGYVSAPNFICCISYNPRQNIWNKMKKSNKTGQEKKSLVSILACF